MSQKFLKITVCTILIMCLFCSLSTAFAENGDVDFDFNIQPIEPTTQVETAPSETETEPEEKPEKETEKESEKETQKETEKETEEETERETEKQTTEKPVQKPVAPQTTEPKETQASNGNQNVNVFVEDDEPASEPETVEESTDEPLPEGSFYVYLERNNGQRRLKTVLTGEDYLPEPEIPTRKGYIFAGWYRDSKFQKKWDFLRDKAKKEMVIYAKWTTDESTVAYDIIVEKVAGGKIEVSPQSASLGEIVSITVTPDEGKRLVQGSVKINGKATDFLSFVMPKGDVKITAAFEEIPEDAGEDEEEFNIVPVIVIGVIAIGILVVVAVIAKKRHDFNADLDPDEEVQLGEEDYYDDWIDESIVVEDGFVEGKKVVESTEPDYGTPEELVSFEDLEE